MTDQEKTTTQLLTEIKNLRQQVADLQAEKYDGEQNEQTIHTLQYCIEQLHAIHYLGEMLSQAETERQVYERALSTTKIILGATDVAIFPVHQELIYTPQPPQFPAAFNQSMKAYAIQLSEARNLHPLFISDVTVSDLLPPVQELLLAHQIQALCIMPLLTHGKPVGYQLFYYDRPYPFSEVEFWLCQMISGQIVFAAGRKQAEIALRASESRYRAIVEDQTELICRFLPDGSLTFVNEAYCRYFDMPRQALLGHDFLFLVPPADQQFIRNKLASLDHHNPVITLENCVVTPNNGVRWQQWTNHALLNNKNQVIEFQSVGRDITERKQAMVEQERLLIAEREQRILAETLGEVFLALTSQISHEAVLKEILRQVQRVISYSAANIMLLEDNVLYSVRWQGYEPYCDDSVMKSLRQSLRHLPLDNQVVQTRQPLVVPDTQNHSDWIVREQFEWIRSFIAVPLLLQEKVLGLLRLDSDKPNKFSSQDVARLQPLAHAAAIAMENALLYEQAQQEIAERKQAEERAHKLNRKLIILQYAGATIAASLDLNLILNTVIKEMIDLLQARGCTIFKLHLKTNSLEIMAEYHVTRPPRYPADQERSPLADFPLAKRVYIARNPQQIRLNQSNIEPSELAYLQDNKLQAALVLPMIFQDQIVGLFELTDEEMARIFYPDDIALAQMLANQAAAAIENARLYQRVQAIAARNQAILDAIPDAMFFLDRRANLLDYKISDDGYILPELIDGSAKGKNLSDMLPPGLVDQTIRHIDKALTANEIQVLEYQLPSPVVSQDFEARLVVSGPDEVLAIVRNITERKQAEQQLIRSERLAALGRLAASVAHEMNNPLQIIQSHLDLILKYSLDPAEKEDYLMVIHNQIERMSDITQQVLDLAKPKAVTRQMVSVTDLVQHVLKLAKKRIEQNNIYVSLETQEVPPVMAVASQLNQVFLNLIINAMEVIPPNGQLHISIYEEEQDVAISFINEGPAIPSEIRPHIFDPFFTTKSEGSGLGLWISHSIIQQHNGTLMVKTLTDDEWVVFTVKLPKVNWVMSW